MVRCRDRGENCKQINDSKFYIRTCFFTLPKSGFQDFWEKGDYKKYLQISIRSPYVDNGK